MQCIKPIYVRTSPDDPVGCGQCMACRISKRREWTGRILLESRGFGASSFATLTYDEDHVPVQLGEDGITRYTLLPRHLQLFFKRLRYDGAEFRYFACGEYGDRTQRPHYHAILFGMEAVQEAQRVERCWEHGYTSLTPLTAARAAYVAAYTVKKMTSDDDERLEGRYPEFARMSRKPAVGMSGMSILVETHKCKGVQMAVKARGDAFTNFRYKGQTYPLGYTLSQKLRDLVGVPLKAKNRDKIKTSDTERMAAIQRTSKKLQKAARRNPDGGRQRPDSI